jgi:hypothetical protein
MIKESVKPQGEVEICIEYKDGSKEATTVKNTVLTTGRLALANGLANQIGSSFDFYVTRMIFGDAGTTGGVKKVVNAGRNGLFGVTQVSKPALANSDTSVTAQVIFTSVILFSEGVGLTLNEMALQMANGDLFSMTTFPDLNKTSDMQITFNWRLNFI